MRRTLRLLSDHWLYTVKRHPLVFTVEHERNLALEHERIVVSLPDSDDEV